MFGAAQGRSEDEVAMREAPAVIDPITEKSFKYSRSIHSSTPFTMIPNSSIMCIPKQWLGGDSVSKSITVGHLGRFSGAYFPTGHLARPSSFFPQALELGSAHPHTEASQENLKIIATKG